MRSRNSSRPAYCGFAPDSQLQFLRTLEKVRWTVSPFRAVLPTISSPKETVVDRYRAGPHRSPERRAYQAVEAAVARSLRNRAAALQQALPGASVGLSHPGTGLWRAQARD